MARRILVLHGPNLNLLGERPGDAPDVTLSTVDRALAQAAKEAGAEIRTVQSNLEGALVDALQKDRKWADAVLVDAGPLSVSGHVLADALQAVALPSVELTPAKKKSVLECDGRVVGKGLDAYVNALQRLVADDPAGKRKSAAGRSRATASSTSASKSSPGTKKTIGRASAKAGAEKSIGRAGGGEKSIGRAGGGEKSIGRASRAEKSIGRASGAQKTIGRETIDAALKDSARSSGSISRATVRAKIAERLRGSVTSSGLATWARQQYLEIQRGAPAESGHRELLEDTLQQLTVSALPASRLSDEELIELMTQLGE